eukprot:366406-Chlamydomonas_euryale.AAC.10
MALPYTISLGTTSNSRSAGNAKLTPLPRPVPDRVNVAVFSATYAIKRRTMRADESSSGPPEFPALIDASVCTMP